MKTILSFLCVICYLTIQTSYAQDLHFTNYDYAPLYLNPAQTGDFAGTARFNGIFREQFLPGIHEPFLTGMGSGEANFNFGLRKRDWTSLGLVVFFDQAGALSFQNTGALISGAYHYALDKKRRKWFSFAGQFGFTQRTIKDGWIPQDLIISLIGQGGMATGSTADLNLFENFNDNGNNTNFNVGIKYTNKLTKTNKISFGASMYHILQSDDEENFAPRRITLHGNLYTQVNKKVGLEYAGFYSTDTDANNVMFQFRSHFSLNKTKRVDRKKVKLERGKVMFGLGYRFSDAIVFLSGYEYKKWQFGIAYDMTVSAASDHNNFAGAIEFGLKRIFLITKRPEVKPVLICPTL